MATITCLSSPAFRGFTDVNSNQEEFRRDCLAKMAVPLEFKPRRGAIETSMRVREQARLQFDRAERLRPFMNSGLADGEGLCRLPEPSPGDVFLDLEGDLFAAEGGREYLFGVVTIQPNGKPGLPKLLGIQRTR